MEKARSGLDKVLVTGSEGFIGRATVKALGNGYEVIPFDAKLGQDITALSPLDEMEQYDSVIHLAAVSSTNWARVNPKGTFTTNVYGTYLLLLKSLERRVKHFVYASSYRVFNPHVSNPYIVSKMLEENIVNMFKDKLSTIGLRYTCVYGPEGFNKPHAMNVLNQIIKAALDGTKIDIVGDGSQTRDFVFVEDVAWCNRCALESGVQGVFDVGTGFQTRMNDAIRLVEEITGKKVKVNYTRECPEDYMRWQQAQYHDLFRCPTSLEKGIEECVRSYLQVGSQQGSTR